jgi:hypothetical protein
MYPNELVWYFYHSIIYDFINPTITQKSGWWRRRTHYIMLSWQSFVSSALSADPDLRRWRRLSSKTDQLSLFGHQRHGEVENWKRLQSYLEVASVRSTLQDDLSFTGAGRSCELDILSGSFSATSSALGARCMDHAACYPLSVLKDWYVMGKGHRSWPIVMFNLDKVGGAPACICQTGQLMFYFLKNIFHIFYIFYGVAFGVNVCECFPPWSIRDFTGALLS